MTTENQSQPIVSFSKTALESCRHGNDNRTCGACTEIGMLKATVESLKEVLDKYSPPVRGEKWTWKELLYNLFVIRNGKGEILGGVSRMSEAIRITDEFNASLALPDNPQECDSKCVICHPEYSVALPDKEKEKWKELIQKVADYHDEIMSCSNGNFVLGKLVAVLKVQDFIRELDNFPSLIPGLNAASEHSAHGGQKSVP